MTSENRIPELDFARGFCILGMIAVHLIYDLTEIYPVFSAYPPFFLLIKNWGGIVFFLIAGISVTLGRRHLRRGSLVFLCGCLVSAVTSLAGFLPIRFGVLQSLGCCMLCWECFKNTKVKSLLIIGLVFAATGWLFQQITVSASFLYPLGLIAADFESGDYFPLFPYLGYFLLGACFGKRYYRNRQSLLPQVSFSSRFSRFLCLCGRHTLFLYLIHQPLLILLIEGAVFIGGCFHER